MAMIKVAKIKYKDEWEMALSNTQYDAIMRVYKERQLNTEALLSERIMEINEKLPEYKKIDDEIASFGVSSLKNILSGVGESQDSINVKIDSLTNRKKELLVGAGYPSDYLEPVYVCPDCKDTGYIGDEKCHCLKKTITSMMYQNSNLDAILATDNFDNLSYEYYDGENLQRFKHTVEQSHEFIQNFDRDYQNLMFYGTVGTGKSFLTGCIAKELLDTGHNVIYFSSTELFKILSDIMFDKGDRISLASMREDIYNSDLLIIDDLGTELLTNAVTTQLFSLLNERNLNRKSMIISTNLELPELQERYSERIFSRFLERFSFFKFSGQDIRKIKRTNS